MHKDILLFANKSSDAANISYNLPFGTTNNFTFKIYSSNPNFNTVVPNSLSLSLHTSKYVVRYILDLNTRAYVPPPCRWFTSVKCFVYILLGCLCTIYTTCLGSIELLHLIISKLPGKILYYDNNLYKFHLNL